MPKEVYMPALGMNQESGTLLRWFKQEGEAVQQGEPLMEVATDKTEVEIEAPASGILRNVTAAEGAEVPVGRVIALIAAPGEVLPADSAHVSPPPAPAPAPRRGDVPASPLAARVAAEHGVDLAAVKPAGGRIQKEDVLAYLAAQAAQEDGKAASGRILASPKARRLALEAGVDLAALHGSGPEGAVLAADVEGAVRVAPAPAAPDVAPMSRMWKVMAERLAASWTTIPHFFLSREVDASGLMAWRTAVRARSAVKLTYTDLLVKVVAAALAAHPRLNASWQNNTIVTNAAIHIGIAVAVEEGLLVPVIRHADRLGVAALAAARAGLVDRAQQGRLLPDDLQGGTFTLSNLGMFGVDHFSAIINPPQAAILAVGRIVEKVVAVNGQPAVRPVIGLNLSCDHRVVDGARAARFLETLAAFVEDPLRLLD